MISFLNHYFLVVSWGEAWFDMDKDLIPQMEANEDPNEVVWEFYNGERQKLTFRDVISAMKREPTEQFIKWARLTHKYAEDNDLEEHASLMASMGCGGSDYLTPKKVKAYVLEELDGRV